MPIADEVVALRIGSREWRAWSSCTINAGITKACRSASLSVSAIDPERQGLIDLVPGIECQVLISGVPVITGWTSSDEISAKDGSKFSIGARSRTCDIVDCTVEHRTGVFGKAKVEEITAALCEAYNVPVDCDCDTGDPLPSFRAKRTEEVLAALGRLAQERGLLFTDDGNGRLHIATVNGDGPVVAHIERGKHYEELTRSRSDSERFSLYRCHGQTADELDATGGRRDAWVSRTRVKTFDSEKAAGKDACLRRAKWEACVRAGKSVKYGITVPGWRIDPSDASSPLWTPNTIAHLTDPVWKVDDDLLIADVTFSRSAGGGTRTTLQLGDPIGYMTKPPKATKRGKGGMTDWFGGTDFDGDVYGEGDEGGE